MSRLVSYVRENVPRIPGKVGQLASSENVKPGGGRRGTEADERGSRSGKREYEFGVNVSDCGCSCVCVCVCVAFSLRNFGIDVPLFCR